MPLKIFKYPIEVVNVQRIGMPIGARILEVKVQNGEPCLWAIVDENEVLEDREIYTFGTGLDFDLKHSTFIGTYFMGDGQIVFHVFEKERFYIANR